MKSLSVRNIEDSVYERLRIRAARHGFSMEEEVRQLILREVNLPERLSSVFEENFGSKNGVDMKSPKKRPHQPMELGE